MRSRIALPLALILLLAACTAAVPVSQPQAVAVFAPVAVSVAQPPVVATVEPEVVSASPIPRQGEPRRVVLPIEYVSQQSEPSPAGWNAWYTPYCVAASSVMVLRYFEVDIPGPMLAKAFAIGRKGNTTDDPGLDPDGNSFLMRHYGGEGRVHAYGDPQTALDELVGRINHGSPVVVFAQAGNHTIVAYGYDADEGGTVVAIYAADPLSGFMGRVPIEVWQNDYSWFGAGFSAPGPQWQGQFVFVSYRDFK